MVGKGIEPIPNPFRVVETPKIEVSKEMVDRAIAIQCLRSDRKLTPTDRTWIEASLKVALDSEYDPFPNAPGLFDEIVSEL